jgi:hypothetical protein
LARLWDRSFFHSLLFVAVWVLLPPFPSFAQVGGAPSITQPPLIRITGALAPYQDTQRSNLQTLIVSCRGKKWRMRIREVKALTATTTQGWSLFKDLFPPRLRLTGPDDILAPLQQDDIAGRPLVLEGRFYVRDHMLYVTAVSIREP